MSKRKEQDIYDQYRRILKMPKLTNQEINKMRVSISLLAQIIADHVLEYHSKNKRRYVKPKT